MDGGNLILRKGANIQLNVTLNSILLLSRVNHLSKPNFCFYDNSTWLGKSDMQLTKPLLSCWCIPISFLKEKMKKKNQENKKTTIMSQKHNILKHKPQNHPR